MIATAFLERQSDEAVELPLVYGAGPIDYVEHRSAKDHLTNNWRHRAFNTLPIRMFCPTCANDPGKAIDAIMATNHNALDKAIYFVGYFPGTVPTFGTPIETWEWCTTIPRRPDSAVLVHPARPGVFVTYMEERYDLVVTRTFAEAREWLTRRL